MAMMVSMHVTADNKITTFGRIHSRAQLPDSGKPAETFAVVTIQNGVDVVSLYLDTPEMLERIATECETLAREMRGETAPF